MTNSRVTPIDTHIAQRLKGLREKSGMLLWKVADHLGIAYQSYQRMEKGDTAFRAASLVSLAELFGVSVTYFYDDAPIPATPNADEIGTVVSLMRRADLFQARSVAAYVNHHLKSNPQTELDV
jgi:transcriptional regulator with XRE-family HTH domain